MRGRAPRLCNAWRIKSTQGVAHHNLPQWSSPALWQMNSSPLTSAEMNARLTWWIPGPPFLPLKKDTIWSCSSVYKSGCFVLPAIVRCGHRQPRAPLTSILEPLGTRVQWTWSAAPVYRVKPFVTAISTAGNSLESWMKRQNAIRAGFLPDYPGSGFLLFLHVRSFCVLMSVSCPNLDWEPRRSHPPALSPPPPFSHGEQTAVTVRIQLRIESSDIRMFSVSLSFCLCLIFRPFLLPPPFDSMTPTLSHCRPQCLILVPSLRFWLWPSLSVSWPLSACLSVRIPPSLAPLTPLPCPSLPPSLRPSLPASLRVNKHRMTARIRPGFARDSPHAYRLRSVYSALRFQSPDSHCGRQLLPIIFTQR